jgi:glc operon protein GlcG
MVPLVRLLFISALIAQPAAVPAAPVDARQAQAVLAGCAAHSSGRGQSHAIVVVDSGGHVVAALRMDGNGFGIMEFARAKAEAADAPRVVTVAGGIPIWSADGRERIGAVGVSGEAPADDAACAEAGIGAAGLRSERAR